MGVGRGTAGGIAVGCPILRRCDPVAGHGHDEATRGQRRRRGGRQRLARIRRAPAGRGGLGLRRPRMRRHLPRLWWCLRRYRLRSKQLWGLWSRLQGERILRRSGLSVHALSARTDRPRRGMHRSGKRSQQPRRLRERLRQRSVRAARLRAGRLPAGANGLRRILREPSDRPGQLRRLWGCLRQRGMPGRRMRSRLAAADGRTGHGGSADA